MRVIHDYECDESNYYAVSAEQERRDDRDEFLLDVRNTSMLRHGRTAVRTELGPSKRRTER